MADAPKILGTDTLRSAYPKLNSAIDNANEALSTANTAKSTADSALSNSENTQTQLDTVVINGDSSVEAAQARVTAGGKTFTTLQARLNDSDAKLAERELTFGVEYNADKTGATQNNTAFSTIIDEALTKGKSIKLPAGTYLLDTSIIKNLGGKVLEIEGEGMFSTVLLWKGTGTMLDISGGGQIRLRKITVSGYKAGDASVFATGTTAFKCTVPIMATEVQFKGFDSFVEWAGGYYYKFINCRFQHTNIGFKGFNANNIQFIACRTDAVNKLITVNAGTGSLNYIGGSIERITQMAFEATSGSKPQVNLIGTYVENYPNETPAAGLTGDYKSAYIAVGFNVVNFNGNTIYTNGIRRGIYSASSMDFVQSVGNIIKYQSTGDTDRFIYTPGVINKILARDTAVNDLTGQTGTYAAVYLMASQQYGKLESCDIFDAFTNTTVIPKPTWTIATLLNGWTQNGTAGFAKVAYRKYKNRVQIKGVADGATATSQAIFNLPADMRPGEYVYKQTGTNANAGSFILRVLTNGDVRCEQTGSNGIILDGLEFELN